MSDTIDPEQLARSRKKFGGFFGAKATKAEEKKEAATKAAPLADDLDAAIDAELDAALDWAKKASEG